MLVLYASWTFGWVADCGTLLNFIDYFDYAFIRFLGNRTIEDAALFSLARRFGVPTNLPASGERSADLSR